MIEHLISCSVSREISVCCGGIRITDGFPANILCLGCFTTLMNEFTLVSTLKNDA